MFIYSISERFYTAGKSKWNYKKPHGVKFRAFLSWDHVYVGF